MKELSTDKHSSTQYHLFLKGSIYFDQKGKEILKNQAGQSFLMDENIKELWKAIETILSRPGHFISGLNALMSKLPHKLNNKVNESLIQKFIELDLIGVGQ